MRTDGKKDPLARTQEPGARSREPQENGNVLLQRLAIGEGTRHKMRRGRAKLRAFIGTLPKMSESTELIREDRRR
jgi:hypothetical protein